MKSILLWQRILFSVAAVYDGLLGLGFLMAGRNIFDKLMTTPPNHMGYIQFPAALLIIFALMFTVIARNPVKHRCLIPYGMLLKLSYAGIVFYYWFTSGIPAMWKPFAICDVIFLVCFIIAFLSIPAKETGRLDQ